MGRVKQFEAKIWFFIVFDSLMIKRTRSDAYISWSGDFRADDNAERQTSTLSPCACARGNNIWAKLYSDVYTSYYMHDIPHKIMVTLPVAFAEILHTTTLCVRSLHGCSRKSYSYSFNIVISGLYFCWYDDKYSCGLFSFHWQDTTTSTCVLAFTASNTMDEVSASAVTTSNAARNLS